MPAGSSRPTPVSETSRPGHCPWPWPSIRRRTRYVAKYTSGNVTVIDGTDNSTATVAAGANPYAVAVTPVTNKIYVANYSSDNVTVIDGSDVDGVGHGRLTSNCRGHQSGSNKIYVANQLSDDVTVIDGSDNSTATVAAGTLPLAVAVNPATNKIYVANGASNNVTVINGGDNNPTPVAAGTNPLAVAINPATNKIYVANRLSDDVR